MAETRLRRSNTCFIKCNGDGQKPAGPVSGWGLEFLSWFKRSPRVGDGGTGGLRWARTPTHLQLGPCLRCQQSPGTTLCFALLLFLLAKRGCLQGGQSMVRIGGKDDGGKTHWGSSLLPPPPPPRAAAEQTQPRVSTSSSVKRAPGDKPAPSLQQSNVAGMSRGKAQGGSQGYPPQTPPLAQLLPSHLHPLPPNSVNT